MFRLVVLAAALAIGCHSSNPNPIIEEPGESVPLPPASGTAIGLLLDDTRLKLRPEQADRLHEIDQQLETRNEALEAQAREMDHPSSGDAGQNAGGHGGGHHGRMSMTGSGMSGGGMSPGGGMSGGPGMSSGGRHHRGGGGSDHAAPSGANQRIADQEAANTKDALAKAFAALDPDQRETAETILQEHGVMAASASAQPAVAPIEGEPAGRDDGQ